MDATKLVTSSEEENQVETENPVEAENPVENQKSEAQVSFNISSTTGLVPLLWRRHI
jgi:hypothetical protein